MLTLFLEPLFLSGLGIIVMTLLLITIDIVIVPTMILSIISITGWFVYVIYVYSINKNIAIVLGVMFFISLGMYLFLIIKFKLWKVISHKKQVPSKKIDIDKHITELNQKTIIASTPLHPVGKIKIDKKIYDGLSEQGFIPQGTFLYITGTFGGQYKVKKKT